MMIVIGIGLAIVLIILNIVQTFLEMISDGRINAARFIIMLIITVISGYFTIFNIPIDPPIIRENEDRTGVKFISEEFGTSVEYWINENIENISKTPPERYKKGEIIPITEDPTEIWFRSSILGRKSNLDYESVHINEYGQVYIRVQPKVPINTITATFNEIEQHSGKASNTFEGYKLSSKDITVFGEDSQGETIKLDGFTYSPEKLKKGENDIDVTYITSSGQELHCSVTIFAHAPELLSIKASIKDEYKDKKVIIGDVLDTGMFDVIGLYENGEKKKVTDFIITPTEMSEEGDYDISISKDGLKDNVGITVIDPKNISESENDEDGANNSTETANVIVANARYKGSLSDRNDVDYYRLTLKQKGRVKIVFEHEKIDSSSIYWVASLLSRDGDEPLVTAKSSGALKETESSTARLSAGVYYIRVKRDYYNEGEYSFRVEFTEEDDYYESEPNNDIQSANDIKVNAERSYVGNLQGKNDYDYYRFALPQKGKVHIKFDHAKKDSSYTYWQIAVLDGSDRTVSNTASKGNETSVESRSFRVPGGDYYIRIKRDSWSDLDYQLSVYYTEEGSEAESEPNDDFDMASEIFLGKEINGNIQDRNDEDYYYINYDGSESLNLVFSHKRTDQSYIYWKVRLYSESSSAPLKNDDNREVVNIKGNDSENVTAHWSNLDNGKYYIKVSRDSFDDGDYSIYLHE